MSNTADLEARMEGIIERQEKYGRGSDKESDHAEADEILTDALRSAGFETLAELYGRVDKWYA